MSTRYEQKLKEYYTEVTELITKNAQIKQSDPDELKYKVIKHLKNQLDLYSEYFEQNINKLSSIKQTIWYRQKQLLELKCRRCVESLGFDYDADFIFALTLDEIGDKDDFDSESDIANKSIRRSKENSSTDVKFISHFDPIVDLQTKPTTSSSSKQPKLNDKQNFKESIYKMESFELKLANSLIPDFDGSAKNMEDFIDKCEFYNDQLKVTDREKLLNFLLKVKILREVKAKISIEAKPTTFEEFKRIITNRFSSKISKHKKMEELQSLSQQNSLTDFATKLENVCADLIKLKMHDKEAAELKTIKSEVEESALHVFTRGLKRIEIRQALIYKEPKSLSDAIQFALEAESKLGTPYEARINQYSGHNLSHTNHNNSNNNYRRNFRNFQPNPNRSNQNQKFSKYQNYSNPNYRQYHIPNRNFTNGNSNFLSNRNNHNYENNKYNNNNYNNKANQDYGNSSRTRTFYPQQSSFNKNNFQNKSNYQQNHSKIHVIDTAEEAGNDFRPQQENQELKQLGAIPKRR